MRYDASNGGRHAQGVLPTVGPDSEECKTRLVTVVL